MGSDQTSRPAKNGYAEGEVLLYALLAVRTLLHSEGRKYFIVAVTDNAVSSRQMQASDVRPPSVLGNAVVSNWKFVSADNKTLTPPGGK